MAVWILQAAPTPNDMPDVRASAASGCLLLVWLPANSCLALLCGPADQPITQREVLRLYRTKDDAFADWHRITSATTAPTAHL